MGFAHWAIWNSRNKANFDNQTWVVDRVWSFINQNTMELDESMGLVKGTREIMTIQQPTRWRPPAFGIFKLNVDAAQSKDMLRARVGAILRDFN